VFVEWTEMAVSVELHNIGDAAIGSELQAVVEHVLSDRPGDWRVSIVGSRTNDNWEMKVEGRADLSARTLWWEVPESTSQ
jgi:hypothetical protein